MSRRRAAAKPADRAAQLDDIYAQIPDVDCIGKCWDSCGSLQMTGVERRRILAAGGPDIPDGGVVAAMCPALTLLKRCSIHDLRPTVCRFFGVLESMPCNYGCRPKDGLLPDAAGFNLLADVLELDGQHEEAARTRELWSTPERAAASSAFLRQREDARRLDYELRKRRAEANGTAVYVHGRGQLSSQPLGGRE